MTLTGQQPLTDADIAALDAYWRAANYLSAGQIYLMGNPLLTEPLQPGHIKPRLLGHWGTSPGLNFIWAHLNRVITVHDQPMMYVIGPGHGGPAALANSWLEGSYSEVYPSVSRDVGGLHELFRQFSFPGGVPSHVAPETPGSIHEGGELGYSLSHAHGAAFDNPGLIVACVIGDGEAETGPLATSWHSGRFLDPASDGAVLPILHLNGWKIANPAVLARIPEPELDALLRGYGYQPVYVTGHEPSVMHQKMAAAADESVARIRAIQDAARAGPRQAGPSVQRWPMIVLRSPKGWTGPAEVDGLIAAMAAAMNGLDVLAFTGGIGEHQPAVRADAAAGLAFLGVAVDPARNAAAAGDADISAPPAGVAALVIAAREDVEIARQVRAAVGMTASG